jgi:hypothetical protein
LGVQRYISRELTHFVGRGRSEEEQYAVLVDGILKSGWLRHSPTSPMEPIESLESGGVSLSTAPNATDIPPGELYRPQVVCFCDIPVSDLEIHMRKYSPFGLSFLKPFLIDKGANPVFYIARNSKVLRFFAGREDELTPERVVSREQLFAHNIREQNALFWRLLLGDPPLHNNGLLVEHLEEHQTLSTLQSFLNVYVFSFLKIFDDTTTDEVPENFFA